MDIVQAPDGSIYIAGMYWGYNDGTNEYPDQRIVSRLYGLNVGMQEREIINLNVFPNPANHHAAVVVPASMGRGSFVVHDLMGREVHREQVIGTDQIKIDVSNWASGLYHVQLNDNEGLKATGKLVVE